MPNDHSSTRISIELGNKTSPSDLGTVELQTPFGETSSPTEVRNESQASQGELRQTGPRKDKRSKRVLLSSVDWDIDINGGEVMAPHDESRTPPTINLASCEVRDWLGHRTVVLVEGRKTFWPVEDVSSEGTCQDCTLPRDNGVALPFAQPFRC